jgi:uncharacterized membrane protein YphA (DoxX/SURF4 family)
MKIPYNAQINLLIRLVVGIVFIITGSSKIIDPALFSREITNYDMLPNFSINLLSIILPWVELIVGILFVFGVRVKANLILLVGMLFMFNFAVAVAWARGLDINCGCYSSVAQQTVGIGKLSENFAMIVALAFMFFSPDDKLAIENYLLESKDVEVNNNDITSVP